MIKKGVSGNEFQNKKESIVEVIKVGRYKQKEAAVALNFTSR